MGKLSNYKIIGIYIIINQKCMSSIMMAYVGSLICLKHRIVLEMSQCIWCGKY